MDAHFPRHVPVNRFNTYLWPLILSQYVSKVTLGTTLCFYFSPSPYLVKITQAFHYSFDKGDPGCPVESEISLPMLGDPEGWCHPFLTILGLL